MEHRSYHRYPLNLDAQISAQGANVQDCRIRDFCLGGLFISFSQVAGSHGFVNGLKVGSVVVIHLNIPTQKGANSFQLKANIARILKGAAGLTFSDPDPAALQALENVANFGNDRAPGSAQYPPKLGRENVHRILALCRRGVSDHLSALLQGFFPSVEEALFAAANYARSNDEQRVFMEAIGELKKRRGKIITSFNRAALDQMDELSSTGTIKLKEQDLKDIEHNLSLVNKDEFEDWLIIKVMISKAETCLQEKLFALHVRFSQLTGGLFNDENNPVGPSVICHSFSSAMEGLEFSSEIEKLIYQSFEKAVVLKLGDMYDDVNSVLINSGVLSEIEFSKLIKGKIEKYGPNISSKEVFDTADSKNTSFNHQSGLNEAAAVSSSAVSAPVASSPAVLHGTEQSAKNSSAGGHVARNGEAVESAGQRFENLQRIAQDSYTTIQRLIKLQKESQSVVKKALPEPSQKNKDVSDASMPPFTQGTDKEVGPATESHEVERKNELFQALGRLQKLVPPQGQSVEAADELSAGQPNSIAEVLKHSIKNAQGEDICLSTDERDMLSNMGDLFRAMLEENRLSSGSAELIKRLEIPLAKVFLQNDSFFSIDQHPARLVVNRLAQIGQKSAVKNVASENAAQRIVDRIVKQFDSDISVFDDALLDLDKLIEKQDKIYSRNVTRLTEACDGQERLSAAKLKVEEALDARLAGKSVPKAIPVLLDAGWKELLTLAYLKEGAESERWQNGLATMDALAEELEATSVASSADSAFDGEARYRELSEKLEQVVSHQTKNDSALNELKRLLIDANSGHSPIERVALPESKLKQVPEAEAQIKLEELADTKNKSADERRLELRKWIRRAKGFKVGNWINLQQEDNEPVRMRIAWISDQSDLFVFVNHQGLKVSELTLVETVKHLFNGVLVLDQGIDLPLVEFGLDSMVQSVYEELSYQSTHDELTGLVNRKEFERQLGRYIKGDQIAGKTHVLLYLDLDQFNLVNSTCGNEGGDQLLKEVANLLQHWMTKEGVIARVNGDEFCILMPNCSENEGYQIADNQHVAIQNHRFSWNDVPYVVGASIGLALLSETTEDATCAMKMAQSACSSAKEGGRNRIQIYRSNDSDLVKRDDLMEWVIKLNQALDEDRLQLRCQEISPINKSEGRLPHYEILLCIEDENGLQIPPGDFIQAAEQYSRMQAVDRWVIAKVFEWMADNRSMLENFGGCAINLSGHSLNDEGLMQFIFEKMVSLDIPRNKLCFEVTETATISHLGDAADFIREMRNIGCKFSLDDFGSGLSSYAYLKNLPVDYIKIDGIFVKDLVDDASDYAMVKSINEMAKFLGKETIAEYVENNEILEKLKEIGVDYAQGYGIRKPILLKELRLEDVVPDAESALY